MRTVKYLQGLAAGKWILSYSCVYCICTLCVRTYIQVCVHFMPIVACTYVYTDIHMYSEKNFCGFPKVCYDDL